MNEKRNHILRALALVSSIILTGFACDGSDSTLNPPPGGSTSNLTALNSVPSDGDATLTVTGSYTQDAFGTGFDELNLSEVTGSVGHDVTITWNTNTLALNGAQHGWGSGFTQCVVGTANPCDTARVAIDVVAKTVTFNNLVLVDDTFGTSATSTLNGTARW
jgi:hypothetical protein